MPATLPGSLPGPTPSWVSLPYRLPAEELARPRNQAKLEKVAVPEEHLELLRHYYRPEVRRLLELTREIDLSLWPDFGDLD